MKKIKFITAFLLLFAVVFVSCDTEPLDNDLLENDGGGNGNGNGSGDDDGDDDGGEDDGSGGENGDAGTYWPMAVNNVWTYEMDGKTQDPMKITSTVKVEGETYYRTDNFFSNAGNQGLTGQATFLLRQKSGDYSVRISVDIPEANGIPIKISPYEIILLKDYLEVGKTWTQKLKQTTSYGNSGIPDVVSQIDILGTIIEKNTTLQVNGKQYKDIIKCSVKQTNLGMTFTTYYWFAKNIGPVKTQTEGDATYTSGLLSYKLN